ncbi:MopE-related protein [Sandaracinus amylolyticus]|uniref:MopE-related protein n=1 Tax=Sandaracinus amylolyticus TaxID=927083 RepID=UPI001470516E|nr:MopE-related protein [Sandaracinus amylolyticus]
MQVDGTIVPVGNALQDALNTYEGVAPPAANAIHAVIDAAQLPEIFLPSTSNAVVFVDIAEGAGFENSFGYYNVGDDPRVTTNLRPIMGCGVQASNHANEVPNYVRSAEAGTSVSVDFNAERTAGRYRGGYIAFYLITPEDPANPGSQGSPNCGDFGSGSQSFYGRAYYTQRDFNNDGDFVHHLVYQSRVTANRFYFGFEDLFRGGDNDYEDMAMQVTGLTPPCSPGVEICNGRDDDCDGLVDAADSSLSDDDVACTCDNVSMTCEGGAQRGVCRTGATACVAGALICRSTVGPSAEQCNNLDDNCDGTVDNGAAGTGVACDGTDADLCNEGVFACTSGALTCTDATGANAETCNGADDDCDTRTDENVPGVGAACDGADGDLCNEGVTTCAGASGLRCSDATGTNAELCNGADDDCDGAVDDGPTDVGVACSTGVGLCRSNGATICSMGAPVCNATPIPPRAERCNALDDDCDGATDETFRLGEACVAPGVCGPGVLECAGDTGTRCSSAPGGSGDGSRAETCNGLDDDCDTRVDEGLTDLGSCGESTGECEPGRLRCLAAAPTCVGGIGPTPEICDGRDNDCNGDNDDMPTDVGASCGDDTGECTAGTQACVGGMLRCQGAVGPGTERCNSLDDDCDAITDEDPSDVGATCGTTDVGVCDLGSTICVAGGLVCAGATEPNVEVCNGDDDDCDGDTDEDAIDVGRVCGSAMGTCTPGITVCVAGAPICQGATTGTPEICNGIDDDCDTVIDDSPSDEGGVCGMGEGVCEEGELRCIAGSLQCVGGVLPGTEVCNGLDDDCNGSIDEGDLCEGGVCVGGRCSVPCQMTEFGERCPSGEICVEHYCVPDECEGVTCEPGPDGTKNVCVEGGCVPACDTVTCDAPNVCRRTDGACVGNNCIFLPYLCTDAQICAAGECVDDPCAGVSCDAGQFCRGGACVGSCAGVRCGVGEVCRGGECESTGCNTPCGAGQVCAGGACVDDPCGSLGCDTGEVCDPTRGECVDDPCRNVTCPGEGEICRLGECYAPSDFEVDAGTGGMDAGTGSGPREVLAAGGGGMCSASGAGTGGASGALAWIALGIVGIVIARRRRSSANAGTASANAGTASANAGTGIALVVALVLGGCEVDPYCVANCDGGAELDAGPGDDAGTDGGTDGGRGRPDGCVVGATEECNESDDDCDGLVDEGIDLTSDSRHCGDCSTTCERTGAQTQCTEGACELLECFDGFVDLNGDIDGPFADTDGCEYRCFSSNGGVEACDTIDNDCDGDVDETFDFQGDEANCGRCGQVCTFFRVTTATCDMGTCEFDPATDCETGYIDQNAVQFDGCEFECTPTGAEVCDGLDNDCDTRTDEGFGLETDPNNCGRCGRVCTFPNATPRCNTGVCGFDPMTDCNAGFSDRDGVQLNGCEYPCTPTNGGVEICDGLDNDCNGRVDGPTTDSGASCNRAPGGTATGVCTSTGTLTCVGATLRCVGAPEPTREICDGLDNDCDGSSDDSPVDVGRVCAPAVGACTAGFSTCGGGTLGCVRAVGPTPEICNGLDDDCDGTIDDMPTDPTLGDACGTDTGECVRGAIACTDGRLVCAGSVGATLETCNNRDDDCDGMTDDDPVDVGGSCGSSVGACVPGSLVCSSGSLVCSGGASASSEICDNQDDDCDGTVDEMLSQSCYTGPAGTSGVGLCRGGTRVCAAGTFGTCAGQVVPAGETCTNTDEDCDGRIDEGVTRACYTGPAGTNGVGLCRGGTQACTAGAFGGACTGQVTPATSESCDSLDDDCDGRTDEGAGGGALTRSCYTGAAGTAGVGTCRAGTQTCRFGAFEAACAGQIVNTLDRCGDTLDTDCDGLNDTAEGCLTAGGELRIDTGGGDDPGEFHSFEVQLASGGDPVGRNVYAVWVDKRNGGSTADVFFSRSTNGGSTFSAPVDLTDFATTRAVAPRIAVGRVGSNDVVYVTFQIVVDGVRNVYVRTSADGGASFGSAVALSTLAARDNFKQSVATSGARAVVAWERLNTSTLDRTVVYAATTNSGANWTDVATVSVNSGATPNAGEPVAAVTSTGRFVFAWRELRVSASPSRTTFDVYATWTDDITMPIPAANERRLDGDTTNARASDDLRIVSDGERVYVAWTDVATAAGGGSDVVFSRSINNGASWSPERILDDPSGEVSSSTQATLAIDPATSSTTDDRLFVAWVDTRDGTQIFLARSTDSGATWSTPVRASQATGGVAVPGVNDSPAIVYAGGDRVIVAYVNDANGASTYRRVRAAVSIDAGASWQVADPVVDSNGGAGGGEADYPSIARADSTTPFVGAVIGWIDFRSGTRVNGDVYRARVGR